ncbi:MAG TPA: hypothetical protein VIJ94_04990, partial [Caulobacteraceae bacterium]
DQAAARALAQTRATTQAQTDCQAYAQTGSFRYQSAKVQVTAWRCEALSGGIVCGMEGNSQCSLQEQDQAVREQCGPGQPTKTG